MNKKTLIGLAIASAVGLSAIGAATFANDMGGDKWARWFGMMMGHGDHGPKGWFGFGGMFGGPQDMQDNPAHVALLAGDYDAFVAAHADMPFAKDITEEQFAKMSAKAKQGQAIQSAIADNDYAAYAAAVKVSYEEMSSQTFFNDMVAKQKTAAAVKAAFEAKDYDAYVAAVADTEQEGKFTEAQFTDMMNGKGKMKGEHKRGDNKWGLDIKGLLSGDYTAFQQAIAGTKLEGKITQDQFNSLVTKFQAKAQK